MLQTEPAVLEDAAGGLRKSCVEASGLTGRWRCAASDGSVAHSAEMRPVSGYLALPPATCKALAGNSYAKAAILECHLPFDATALELDAWGEGQKFFCLCEPLRVARRAVALMAPLADSD